MTLDNDVKLALTNFKDAVLNKVQSFITVHNQDANAHSSIRNSIPTNNNQLTNGAGFITDNDIPTNVSNFNNDAGYITSSDIPDDLSDFNNDTNFITINDVSQAGYITDSAITAHNSNNSAHSTLFSSKADTVHTHTTNDVSDNNIYDNIRPNESSHTQKQINSAVDDELTYFYDELGTISAGLNSKANSTHTHSDWTPVPHNFDNTVTILKNEALRMIFFKCYRDKQKFPLSSGPISSTDTGNSYLPYNKDGTGAGYIPSDYRPIHTVVGGCFNPKLTFAINNKDDGRIIIHSLESHNTADWAVNFTCFYLY